MSRPTVCVTRLKRGTQDHYIFSARSFKSGSRGVSQQQLLSPNHQALGRYLHDDLSIRPTLGIGDMPAPLLCALPPRHCQRGLRLALYCSLRSLLLRVRPNKFSSFRPFRQQGAV